MTRGNEEIISRAFSQNSNNYRTRAYHLITQQWREETRLRQMANVRFKLRISQQRK